MPSGIEARTMLIREKPPFNVGDARFTDKDVGMNLKNSPEYHCAYSDVVDRPNRWDTKGWATLDDPIKPKRGTSTGKLQSSMAPPTAPPMYGASIQPMQAVYPNETRLQELLELQRRKMKMGPPPPGAYEVHLPPRRSTFRRPNHPALDGPFYLEEGEDGHLPLSTRAKEIAVLIRNPGDSGHGPGEYSRDVLSKDITSYTRNPPAFKIGTSSRDGHAPPQAKSLSVSRSIQHGINYRVPVIVQAPPELTKAMQQRQREEQARSLSAGDSGIHAPDDLGGDNPQSVLGARASTSPPRYTRASTSPRYTRASTSPRYTRASTSPPRYMEPIHDTSPNRPKRPAKLLPPPPAGVMRSGIPRAKAMNPGNWDWNKLGHNFRVSWTTSGGGAYSHGDRSHERRSSSPTSAQQSPERAQPQSTQSTHATQAPRAGAPSHAVVGSSNAHLSGLWPAFGPNSSSIDISKLPPTSSPIFPIPEEGSQGTLQQDASGRHVKHTSSQRPAQLPHLPSFGSSRASSSSSAAHPHGAATGGRHGTPPRQSDAAQHVQHAQHALHAAGDVSGWDAVGGGGGVGAGDEPQEVAVSGSRGSVGGGVGGGSKRTLNQEEGSAGERRVGGGQQQRQLPRSNSLLELPGAANLLVTPSDVERHDEAQQAASVVHQVNARRSEWLARSTPPSSSYSQHRSSLKRGAA